MELAAGEMLPNKGGIMRAHVKLIIDNNDPYYVRLYEVGGPRPSFMAMLHVDQFHDLFGPMAVKELQKRQAAACDLTLEWVND
jgi:hypothetical protein